MVADYALLPPEINSTRMYTGPRSGSMWAAAAAWDGLSVELGSAASSFQGAVSALSGAWRGPSSMSMAAAAAPYVAWLSAASAHAEQVANQARLSAGAFEAAFTATVPPPVIAANRAQLAMLIATNILGQNTAAIAATEAQYVEMWAQDVTAMVGYDASTTTAEAAWTPFSEPPAGLPGAATQTSSVTSIGPQLLSSLTQPRLLSSLSNAMPQLEMLSTPAELAVEPMTMLTSQLMTSANPLLSATGSGVPPTGSTLVSTVGPGMTGPSAAQLRGFVVSGSAGRADSVGALSVPASWANAVSATTPTPAAVGVPDAGVSPASAGVPRMPYLPSTSTPGRGTGAVTPAVAAPRAGAVPGTALHQSG